MTSASSSVYLASAPKILAQKCSLFRFFNYTCQTKQKAQLVHNGHPCRNIDPSASCHSIIRRWAPTFAIPQPCHPWFSPSISTLLFFPFHGAWYLIGSHMHAISTTWRETCLIISLMLHCWHGRNHWHCLNILSFLSKSLVHGSCRFWFHSAYIHAALILLLIFLLLG